METEQIRDEYAVKQGYTSWEDMYQKSFLYASRVDEVMNAYAKQVAIDFANWKSKNYIKLALTHNIRSYEDMFDFYLKQKGV